MAGHRSNPANGAGVTYGGETIAPEDANDGKLKGDFNRNNDPDRGNIINHYTTHATHCTIVNGHFSGTQYNGALPHPEESWNPSKSPNPDPYPGHQHIPTYPPRSEYSGVYPGHNCVPGPVRQDDPIHPQNQRHPHPQPHLNVPFECQSCGTRHPDAHLGDPRLRPGGQGTPNSPSRPFRPQHSLYGAMHLPLACALVPVLPVGSPCHPPLWYYLPSASDGFSEQANAPRHSPFGPGLEMRAPNSGAEAQSAEEGCPKSAGWRQGARDGIAFLVKCFSFVRRATTSPISRLLPD